MNIPPKGILKGEYIMDKCCTNRIKKRTEKEYRSLSNRLSRIEGQVRGVQNMLDKNAYCTDILVQVSAITAALNAFNRELLSSHIKTCVIEDIKSDNTETVEELIEILKKLMK